MKIDFFISPEGNDSWSGTKPEPSVDGTDGPLSSLTAARDAAAKLKCDLLAANAERQITVALRGGEYYLPEPFDLCPKNSGSKDAPIVYRAMEGETPILSGGRRVSDWIEGEDGIWSAHIPEVQDGSWFFRSLWVNGERRSRPRLPKSDYFKVAAPAENKHEAFKYNQGEIDVTWRNRDDVEIVVVQFWTEARLRIKEIDEDTQTVSFTGASWRPLDWSKAWFAENVFEALGEPGEWYLDRPTGTLYYKPLEGEDPNDAAIMAPSTGTLIDFRGAPDTPVEWVTFQDLALGYTYWEMPEYYGISIPQAEIPRKEGVVFAGNLPYGQDLPQVAVSVPATIRASGMRNCTITGCEIAHTGGWAVELFDSCKENTISGNHMFDIGAGAVRIGDPACPERDEEESAGNMVIDNTIHDGSKVFLGPAAIWIGQSSQNRISYNEIYNDFEWAISVGWNWNYWPPNRHRDNIVEFNHVHHLGESHTGCHGAIYFLGVSPGTICRNNVIHHITGGCGIILDNACYGILIENNITFLTGSGGLCFNYNDSGNIVQNNIFALSEAWAYERFGDPPATGGEKVDQTGILYRNIFYWKSGSFLRRDSWPNFDTLMNFNLYWDASGKDVVFAGTPIDAWREKGLGRHSIVADPLFVDPERGDFTLQPGSPAFDLGFKQIDASGVGPRATPDEYR